MRLILKGAQSDFYGDVARVVNGPHIGSTVSVDGLEVANYIIIWDQWTNTELIKIGFECPRREEANQNF